MAPSLRGATSARFVFVLVGLVYAGTGVLAMLTVGRGNESVPGQVSVVDGRRSES